MADELFRERRGVKKSNAEVSWSLQSHGASGATPEEAVGIGGGALRRASEHGLSGPVPAAGDRAGGGPQVRVRCDSAEGLLTLMSLRGIGPRKAERLASKFASFGDVRKEFWKDLAKMLSLRESDGIFDGDAWKRAHARAHRILDRAHKQSVRVLAVADPEYPEWLREIPDRPPVVYVKGALRPGRRYVACIGTRQPSRFGETVTRRITAHLAENGWSIVSGLAIGVDTLAHQAALDAEGHTVAVLGNGLDMVYPKENHRLAGRILEAGGAWLSEQPFGEPAVPRNLVSRDRIQSGMSAGTVVMQTDIRGGSMHTVRETLLQDRLLFAPVPKGTHSREPKSRGVLELTQKNGTELAESLKAGEKYLDLLQNRYRDKPPAIPISSRDDYKCLLGQLEGRLPSPVMGSKDSVRSAQKLAQTE